jgi:predicted transcriptional regulator
MATTTIRVSTKVRDLLHDLAHQMGTSAQHVLEDALNDYHRRQFLATLNAAYLAAQANSNSDATITTEESEWDRTLLDGLDTAEV